MKKAVVVACALFFLPGVLTAQQNAPAETDSLRSLRARDDRLSALEQRVRALEDELTALKDALKAVRPEGVSARPGGGRLVLASGPGPAAVNAAPEPGTSAAAPQVQAAGGPLPVYGGAGAAAAKALNPDISVIGDFLGAAGHNNIRRQPGLELHETEVSLQAIIDPYARGDFFLSFGETGVNVEEGYLTFTSLPAGIVAKAGKMRAAFGKVNTIHNHALEWTDRPLVTGNLVGGEDGVNDAGLSITRILPAPKGIFLEATAQVYRGDSADLFMSNKRTDVSYVGHLRGYKDLTESTNVDLGFSYARGHNDVGSAFRTQLYGIDAALRWKPLRRAIYHSFLARTEIVWSQRGQLSAALLPVPETQKAFGFFTSGEYRMTRRWTVGARYDHSDRARQANFTDSGFSTLLTYWPSEFSQVRGQYRFSRFAERKDAHEFLFQFLFVLGAHGAHPF